LVCALALGLNFLIGSLNPPLLPAAAFDFVRFTIVAFDVLAFDFFPLVTTGAGAGAGGSTLLRGRRTIPPVAATPPVSAATSSVAG